MTLNHVNVDIDFKNFMECRRLDNVATSSHIKYPRYDTRVGTRGRDGSEGGDGSEVGDGSEGGDGSDVGDGAEVRARGRWE